VKYTVIGISGKRGAGKDTLATALSKDGWFNIKFATFLKKRVQEDFGLTDRHTDGNLKEVALPDWNNMTPRDIMTIMGTEGYRRIDPDFFVKKAFEQMEEVNAKNAVLKFCISDLRFHNEAAFIREKQGHIVRVNRPLELNIYKTLVNTEMETQLDDYQFDKVLENRTMDEVDGFALVLDKMYGDFIK